jgi:hypothetical protein
LVELCPICHQLAGRRKYGCRVCICTRACRGALLSSVCVPAVLQARDAPIRSDVLHGIHLAHVDGPALFGWGVALFKQAEQVGTAAEQCSLGCHQWQGLQGWLLPALLHRWQPLVKNSVAMMQIRALQRQSFSLSASATCLQQVLARRAAAAARLTAGSQRHASTTCHTLIS